MILYWDKDGKGYVTEDTARQRDMRGIQRHHFVTKKDLIDGGGLPSSAMQFENSQFYLGYKDKRFKLPSPRDNDLNIMTLEPWAGEVVVVESYGYIGLIDVNTGEFLISINKNTYAIYPLSKDYFIVVDRDIDNKKIVNRNNQILDSVKGTYVKRKAGDQILREVLTNDKDNKYRSDGRFSIKTLKRYEETLKDRQLLKDTVLRMKKQGVGFKEIYNILSSTYHSKNNENIMQ